MGSSSSSEEENDNAAPETISVEFDFCDANDWIANLAEDEATRSNTSVCLKFTDARIQDGAAFAKSVAKRLEAENIVVADGAWSARQPLLDWLPLRPVKGHYLLLKGEELIQHTIRTPDVYMVPREDGLLYIGATMEEEGFCHKKKAGHVLDLLYHSWQFLRGIYELELLECGIGFRPALRDHQPGIGRAHLSNLWLNVGHFRHGILLAPAAARLLCDQIENPQHPSPFDPLRFWKENEDSSQW